MPLFFLKRLYFRSSLHRLLYYPFDMFTCILSFSSADSPRVIFLNAYMISISIRVKLKLLILTYKATSCQTFPISLASSISLNYYTSRGTMLKTFLQKLFSLFTMSFPILFSSVYVSFKHSAQNSTHLIFRNSY